MPCRKYVTCYGNYYISMIRCFLWVSPHLPRCYHRWLPRAASLCGNLWNSHIFIVQHHIFRTSFELSVYFSYGHYTQHNSSSCQMLWANAADLSLQGDQFLSPKLMACRQVAVGVAAVWLTLLYFSSVSVGSLCVKGWNHKTSGECGCSKLSGWVDWKTVFFVHFHVRRLIE
jgi:hypothetical protein